MQEDKENFEDKFNFISFYQEINNLNIIDKSVIHNLISSSTNFVSKQVDVDMFCPA